MVVACRRMHEQISRLVGAFIHGGICRRGLCGLSKSLQNDKVWALVDTCHCGD